MEEDRHWDWVGSCHIHRMEGLEISVSVDMSANTVYSQYVYSNELTVNVSMSFYVWLLWNLRCINMFFLIRRSFRLLMVERIAMLRETRAVVKCSFAVRIWARNVAWIVGMKMRVIHGISNEGRTRSELKCLVLREEVNNR